MTGAVVGAVLASAPLLGDDVAQNVATLAGTGLMVTYVVMLHRELKQERTDRREEQKLAHEQRKELLCELSAAIDAKNKKCSECDLARDANAFLRKLAAEKMEDIED